MRRARWLMAVVVCGLFAAATVAQEKGAALQTAQGNVDKVEKDRLTIRPRGPGGKFEKNLTLRITGTSKVSTLSQQVRGKKAVVVQRDTDPKDLQPGQGIAVIYTTAAGGAVLLQAVVSPPAK